MSIYLGNITFNQVFDKLGYKLTNQDKIIWSKYHNSKADLSGMDDCFHVFDIPIEIHFKGKNAREAIMKMFTSDKLVESKGTFKVCSVK